MEGSVLQKEFALTELMDLETFREVCQSYSELFQIGFKIFDASRELLVDVKGSGDDFCAYVFQFPQGKSLCTQEVTRIREMSVGRGETSILDCFSGLRYFITPIVHEGNVIGKVVYGPYFPVGTSLGQLPRLGERFNFEIANRLIGKVRKVQDDVVKKVVGHLVQVIEVMLYIGYKQALTSRMHVEAATSSYAELQEKNRALRESFERLKELDRLKSSFLATVSHELRTPLTSVIGYSEMLLEGLAGQLSSEQREYVSTIMEKGEQLLSLISSILDFSKIESGNLQLNWGVVNIADIARSAISTLTPIAQKKEIEIDFFISPQTPTVHADGDKVRQILINILSNAVKFTRNAGKVSIRVEPLSRSIHDNQTQADLPVALAPVTEEWVCISIGDTGIGIPQDKLHRIFDSFYQVDGSSTREYGGTGLGLAIVRSLIDAHGGKIEVESQEGQGTKFAVLLPRERPQG